MKNTTTNDKTCTKKIKAEILAVGVDVHLRRYVFRHQYDGGQPKPAQAMTPEKFRTWILTQKSQAQRIVCCYEAGPFGYGLARFLKSHGIECHVVAPEKLDRKGKRVKTDKTDALALLCKLESYLKGNKEAFSAVRIPGEQEERERALCRTREQLKQTRLQAHQRAKSLLMTQGFADLPTHWWKSPCWKKLAVDLEDWLVNLLESYRTIILQADEQERRLQKQLCERTEAPQWCFLGLGHMTYTLILREICSWYRFQNRRQVSGYTGLCPGVHTSNGRGFNGPVNKHGNPRLRWLLVELAWRVIRFQPNYWKIKRMEAALAGSKARRKQAAAAIARQLAVDMWRLGTGQTTLEKLGLKPA